VSARGHRRRGAAAALFALALFAACAADEPAQPFHKLETPLLLFGVDGATWDVMGPLIAQQRLPNFARLMATGSHAPLATLTPTKSPPIWTTIATGVLPEEHGIDSFVVKLPGSGETTLPSSNLRKVPALWNILSDFGYRVGVANWWASYPAEAIDGFVITDRASQARKGIYRSLLELTAPEMSRRTAGEMHPPELRDELARAVPAVGQVDPALVSRFAALPPETMDELLAQTAFTRENRLSVLKFVLLQDGWTADAALHALERFDPDFTAVFLSGLDAVEHHFWKFMEPEKFTNVSPEQAHLFGDVVERYYEFVDELLGRFLAAYDGRDLNVIVVSDHGHGADSRHGTPRAKGQSLTASGSHGHAPDGILIVSGPQAARGAQLRAASVTDVTPTVLALLGVPVGEDMAGRVLGEALDPVFLEAHPVRSIASHADGARPIAALPVRSSVDDEIKGKLRALGYIE
jgi:predicted AlkP superfamily pyrophosphatase or phosphodiesterase